MQKDLPWRQGDSPKSDNPTENLILGARTSLQTTLRLNRQRRLSENLAHHTATGQVIDLLRRNDLCITARTQLNSPWTSKTGPRSTVASPIPDHPRIDASGGAKLSTASLRLRKLKSPPSSGPRCLAARRSTPERLPTIMPRTCLTGFGMDAKVPPPRSAAARPVSPSSCPLTRPRLSHQQRPRQP